MIELSPDQQHAFDDIFAALKAGERELVLAGVAGSGKTTLMRSIIERCRDEGRQVILMAPTGKAAARLFEVTGHPTRTVHSLLYAQVFEDEKGDLAFAKPRAIAQEGSNALVICDEASMLGSRIYSEILEWLPDGVSLLCVGDREQLQPVRDTWGPDFDNPTALLTQIHRQAAGSPIIQLATAIREGRHWRSIIPDGKYYQRSLAGARQAATWLSKIREAKASGTLLTYTNRIRKYTNEEVRLQLGRKEALCVGDTLLCRKNCHWAGIMNGETVDVRGFDPVMCHEPEDGPSKLVRLDVARNIRPYTAPSLLCGADSSEWDEIDADTTVDNDHVMRAEYGECLTCHSAQGSQWKNVGVIIDYAFENIRNPAEFRRMLYTAVTRAEKKLVIFTTSAG